MLHSISFNRNHKATGTPLYFEGEPRKKRPILPPASPDTLDDSFYTPKKPTLRVSDLRAILLGGGEEARQQVEREDRIREAMDENIHEKAQESPGLNERKHPRAKAYSRKPMAFLTMSDSLLARNTKEFLEIHEATQKADAHERQQIEEEYEMVEKGGPSAYYQPGQTPHPGWVPIEAGRKPEQHSRIHKIREWIG